MKFLINTPTSIEDIDFEHVNDNLPRYGTAFDYNGELSNWCAYVHINKANNKMYFGISSNLRDRWSNYGKRYKGCDAIYNAFMSLGWDSFEHIVLLNGLTKQMASQLEIYLIEKYNTRAETQDGYNIAGGGIHNMPKTTKSIHQYDLNGIYIQTFDSIREATICTGCYYGNSSPISNVLNSEHPYAFGYLWSLELVDCLEPYRPFDKRYIDEYHKIASKNLDKVYQISKSGDIINVFTNLLEIPEQDRYYVREVCEGKKLSNLFHDCMWVYEKDYTKENIESLQKSFNLSHKCMAVDVYNKDGEFLATYESLKEAGEKTNSFPNNICNCCKGIYKIYNNLQFRYHGDPAPGKYNGRYKKTDNPIGKFDINTGELLMVYNYYHDIDTDGYIHTNVMNAVKGKYKSAYGYTWKYV